MGRLARGLSLRGATDSRLRSWALERPRVVLFVVECCFGPPRQANRRLSGSRNLELVAIACCSIHEGDWISPRSLGRPFQKPRCPPAGVLLARGTMWLGQHRPAPRAAKHLAADRRTLNHRPEDRKSVAAAAVCCGTKQYRCAFIG
jgi:hypothetical protein